MIPELKTQRHWLVTGVAGFIGSHLLESLLGMDQHVIGLDNFSTGHQENLDQVQQLVSAKQWSQFELKRGDVSDFEVCRASVQSVDSILHQAALGSVPRSLTDPVSSNQANVAGTLNLMQAAKEAGIDSFVYASSSAVYGDHPGLPKVEGITGRPLSPYAITKIVNEQYADMFFSSYGFRSIGLRYFNVFGPRQDPNGAYAAVIPKWYSAMLSDEQIQINGDGETSRDFCFIQNVVQANLLAAEACRSGKQGVFNVAVGGRTTLNHLFELMKESLKEHGHCYDRSPISADFRSGDVRHSHADIAAAKEQLGYQPTHTIEQGLSESATWYEHQQRLAIGH